MRFVNEKEIITAPCEITAECNVGIKEIMIVANDDVGALAIGEGKLVRTHAVLFGNAQKVAHHDDGV